MINEGIKIAEIYVVLIRGVSRIPRESGMLISILHLYGGKHAVYTACATGWSCLCCLETLEWEAVLSDSEKGHLVSCTTTQIFHLVRTDNASLYGGGCPSVKKYSADLSVLVEGASAQLPKAGRPASTPPWSFSWSLPRFYPPLKKAHRNKRK